MPAPNRKHPGITLIRPGKSAAASRQRWRARYIDPDSGKYKWETAPKSVTNADQRREWAESIYERVEHRRRELAERRGRRRGPPLPISKAVERFFEDRSKALRASTVGAYRDGTNEFEAWCGKNGVTTLEDLDRKTLARFKTARENAPKHTAQRGSTRGKRRATKARRSPEAVNRELRAVKTCLRHLEKLEELPSCLTLDDITRGLELVPLARARPKHLRTPELKQLLRSALDHDRETFKITRAEHKLGVKSGEGTTARHPAIAPFTTLMLLTGMRFSEAMNLQWKSVRLEGGGTIHLDAGDTKTKIWRDVDLSMVPGVRALLVALRPKKASGRVFPDITEYYAQSALRRMKRDYKAPQEVTWKILRATCGTYLTCAPSIFGAASAYMSARQLGHGVAVAEKHYLGMVQGIPDTAKTLEEAMGIEDEVAEVIEAVRARR